MSWLETTCELLTRPTNTKSDPISMLLSPNRGASIKMSF